MAERLLRTDEVLKRVGLGRTTVWRMERAGEFPARRRIQGNLVAWRESEVEEWIETRPRADLGVARHASELSTLDREAEPSRGDPVMNTGSLPEIPAPRPGRGRPSAHASRGGGA